MAGNFTMIIPPWPYNDVNNGFALLSPSRFDALGSGKVCLWRLFLKRPVYPHLARSLLLGPS